MAGLRLVLSTTDKGNTRLTFETSRLDPQSDGPGAGSGLPFQEAGHMRIDRKHLSFLVDAVEQFLDGDRKNRIAVEFGDCVKVELVVE